MFRELSRLCPRHHRHRHRHSLLLLSHPSSPPALPSKPFTPPASTSPPPAPHNDHGRGFPESAALFFQRFEYATMVYDLLCQVPWGLRAVEALNELDFTIDCHIARSVLRRDLPVSTALGFFRWLERSKHFAHTVHTYSAMIDALGRAGRIVEMNVMLEEMRDSGIGMGADLLSSLLSWCAKANELKAAVRFWKQASAHNSMSYNVMLDLLAKEQRYKTAAKLYLVMAQKGHPNAWTFAIIIKLLAQAGKLDAAFLVLSILPKLKIRPNVYAYATLMRACAEFGYIGKVKQLATDLTQINHWRGEEFIPVIKVLIKAGKSDEADMIARELWPEDGWRHRVLKYDPTLKDEDDEGLSVCYAGFGDEENDNHLVNDFRLEGASKLGLSVVGLAKAVSCWSCSTVSSLERMKIDWHCQLAFQVIRRIKDVDIASKFFYWLKSRPGFKHDLYTYTFMAIKLAHEGNFGAVRDLLVHLEDDGLQISLTSFNTLIRYCSIAKKPREALHLLQVLERKGLQPNGDTYAALIHVFAKGKNASKVLDCYRQMRHKGLQPGVVTFSQLIHCVGFSGGTETAHWLFEQMSVCDMEPGAHHYAALIGVYCKAGNKEIAMGLYQDMTKKKIEIPIVLYPVFQRILQQCGHGAAAKKLATEAKELVKKNPVRSSRQYAKYRRKVRGDSCKEQDLRLVYDILVQNLIVEKGLLSVGHE